MSPAAELGGAASHGPVPAAALWLAASTLLRASAPPHSNVFAAAAPSASQLLATAAGQVDPGACLLTLGCEVGREGTRAAPRRPSGAGAGAPRACVAAATRLPADRCAARPPAPAPAPQPAVAALSPKAAAGRVLLLGLDLVRQLLQWKGLTERENRVTLQAGQGRAQGRGRERSASAPAAAACRRRCPVYPQPLPPALPA